MKSVLSLLLISVLTAMNTFAQQTIQLWPEDTIPNYQESNVEEEYTDIFILNVQKPSIEVFSPSKQLANGAAVLICPGGGYGGVAYDYEGTDVAKYLNSRGIAGFVLKYRMPQAESVITSYKAPLQDAQRAIRWIKYNAEKFNINTGKVGVMGFSAGGHLASTLGTQYDRMVYEPVDLIDALSARPDFMMLIYPVISMKEGIAHNGSKNKLLGKDASEELIESFSSELQVTENTPPTFLIHAGDDDGVPVQNSILMYQALLKHDVKTAMHLYPTGGHGFSLGHKKDGTDQWIDLGINRIKRL